MALPVGCEELFLAHAAGTLNEPVALAVATHLALNDESRTCYRGYEAVGGALLDDLAPIEVRSDAWSRLVGKLGDPEGELDEAQRRIAMPSSRHPHIPVPLRGYLPRGYDGLDWKHFGPVSEADILSDGNYRARIIRLKAGRAVPQHSHHGSELTVVLEGAFHDGHQHYRAGDLSIADDETDHRPVADMGRDCFCLTVTDAPLRLTGPLGRLINPFVNL